MFRQMYEEKYMRFPDGKCKAVTFSYDDGVSADMRLVQILDEYGLKGTFNLNSLLFDCRGWHNRMNEEQTYSTFANGPHEVALHGARHVFMDKVPLPEAVNEIVQNRVYLENKFGRIVRGMAYAYNAYTDEILNVLPSLGVVYARTTEDTKNFHLPQNFLKWHPTIHHRSPEFPALAKKFFESDPEKEWKHRESLLFCLWGHSYEFDDDNNWVLIERFAKEVATDSGLWCATNMEIYEYVAAYRSLVFSIDGERAYNPSAIPVWVELRNKVYKIDPAGTILFDREI